MSTININPASTGDILIVDDTQSDLKLLTGTLRKAGYTVRLTTDGELALRSVQAKLPEMILVDIKMPDLDGYEVCRRLRDSEDTMDIPVIFISVNTSYIEKVKAFGVGAVDYITKPFEPEEVLARVATHLALRKTQKEIEEKNLQLQQEITERKRTEDALRESEENFRSMYENTPIGIARIFLDFKIIEVNKAYCDMLGYSKEELIGKTLSDITHPEVLEENLRKQTQLGKGEITSYQMEKRFIKKDGATVYGILNATLIHDKQGNPFYFMGNVLDITERKRAEERINHLNLALYAIREVNQLIVREKDRDRLLQGVCDQLIGNCGYYNAWIILLDDNGHLITTAESGLGKDFLPMIERLKRGELIDCGRKAMKQSGVVVTEDPLSACADCPLSEKYAGRGAMTVRLAHGEKVYGLASMSIPAHFCADEEEQLLFKDISEDIAFALYSIEQEERYKQAEGERKKLEAQFQQSQKMEAIGTLAGGVAHDFNNLLTTIIGNTDIILMDLGRDDPLRGVLGDIKKAGERAASLTRQLLAFSRKQVIKPEVLELNHMIRETDKMLRRLIGEDVELITVLGPELGKVNADPGQIDQVIMNLAVNARDAMPRGGKLTIETANVELDEEYFRSHAVEEHPGAYVMLAVSDTGIGMDEETQSHIFEPLFTTKQRGGGTGLGLSTVYGIIKQSGGFIWVYSESKGGTTFKVYLPRVEGDAESVKKELPPMEGLRGSETILIVEDDDPVRVLTQKVLKRYGYRVLEAREGEEALRVAQEHEGTIKLMLTDVVMPGMSGKELAERLQPLIPGMKVIYMSGYMDNAIDRRGILPPEMDFLQKPFTPEGLAKKVRKVLDKGIDD